MKKETETKCVMICRNCGSDNTQLRAWVKPNENNLFVDYTPDEDGYCCDCETNSEIDSVSLKATAKVVGFQVVGKDDLEGEIHPDMDASFCLYNLTQARKMIKLNPNYWRLLTIWNGDVEEPTMMFKGDPRK